MPSEQHNPQTALRPTTKRSRDTSPVSNQPTDPRFAKAAWDPRFSRVPKRAKKAITDDRFQQRLKSNPAFRTTLAPVDRFGRPKRRAPALNRSLREIAVDSGEESAEEDSGEDIEINEDDIGAALRTDGESSEESEIDDEFLEGREEDEDEDEDIPRGKATRRLAVLGLDWSTTRAVDIYASLNSFCPAGKTIEFVEVHPSKFGLERLAVEAKFGPQVVAKADLEVVEEAKKKNLIQEKKEEGSGTPDNVAADDTGDGDGNSDSDSDAVNSDEGDVELQKWKSQKALRQYEEERLKYYYGVVQFEDVKSADAVYEQCDGVEYSQSGQAFDLRFIPDDMTIETTPRDRADKLPDRYKPPDVTLSSLNNSNVKLTWDADDPDRVILKKRVVSKHEEDEENLKAYLAGSSDEEDKSPVTDVEKKRNMLLGAVEEDQAQDEEMEMEISFEPGMLERGEEIVKRKQERDEHKDESAWEARLRRQEERKAEKRKKRREPLASKAPNGDANSHDGVEDVNDDLAFESDPFFSVDRDFDEAAPGADMPLRKNEKVKKKREKTRTLTEAPEKARAREEEERKLETLMRNGHGGTELLATQEKVAMADSESDDERDMRRKKSRGKRRHQREKSKGMSMLDTNDPRFQQLFDSHLYAVDPTHPKFRGDETSKSILRGQATRAGGRNDDMEQNARKTSSGIEGGGKKSEAMELVARIKAKAAAKRKRKGGA